jgi:hypothetical protein
MVTCGTTPAPVGTPCSDSGGIACDGKGNCIP